MARSPIRTLLAVRDRETATRVTALTRAQQKAREEEAKKVEAERVREEHRNEVRAEVKTWSDQLERGACTAADLERLAMYTLGATLRDHAYGETVTERTALLSMAQDQASLARQQLAEAKVASRIIEKRAGAIDLAEARRLEARREEDP